MPHRQPSEIARETLRQLAARRLAPTPDLYQAVYEEVSGQRLPAAFPDGPLRAIGRVLPAQNAAQKRVLDLYLAAVAARDWVQLQSALVAYAQLGLDRAAVDAAAEPVDVSPRSLAEQLARWVDHILPALGGNDSRLHAVATQLAELLRSDLPSAARTQALVADFGFQLGFAAEEQEGVRAMLLALLRLLFENIAELSIDDAWLHGQAGALLAATTPPVSLRQLDEAQRRLKDVIFKQSQAKARSVQAQAQMKEMLSTFIERLSHMAESSGAYRDQVERCVEQIGRASTIEEIAPVLQEVIAATRAMSQGSRAAHEELAALRERAERTHGEVHRLQQELDRASAQARHDPLTGALNRKGLDEAFEREVERSRRNGDPLCVALLDLDDFKRINDELGHDVGDAALIHLADVARACLRKSDMLARYGGEEFVLLLPETPLAAGVDFMQRLQRELTRHYFLQGSDKRMITFSAGVAELGPDESGADALKRADQGMYLAKRAGKNRVMA
ncbi:GGDEF domain-containing protein [Xylophilus sp.]|uniref:GGDEF domain-containing protein n=1 Tax=Xylophilus sp. TaxID=2653893 RepID=UPI0013BD1A99|nr:GGDEF domain-containing protein [Xylophilus sp.]KAF1047059.1 MAG: Response regulator PleD [Xylophilus sp.]